MGEKGLAKCIILSALVLMITLYLDVLALRWIFKLGTMGLIIFFAVQRKGVNKKYKSFIITGLSFSIVADGFLLIEGKQWFILGLIFFLIAHLLYIGAFVTRYSLSFKSLLFIGPIVVYALFMLRQLYAGMLVHQTIELWIPVVVYVITISTMCGISILSSDSMAIIGAILFVISDSILAWDKFINPLWFGEYLLMATYFAAQYFIAKSIGIQGRTIKIDDVYNM